MTHNVKVLGVSPHILMPAVVLTWALVYPTLYFFAISLQNGALSVDQLFVFLAIPLLPPLLAMPYINYKMWRGARSKSLIEVNTLNAERGRRIGYLESLRRSGRTDQLDIQDVV